MPKSKATNVIPLPSTNDIFQMYASKLDTDVQYSLLVDETNKYNLTEVEKQFVLNYIDFRNIPVAAQLTGISLSVAKTTFAKFGVKQEIDRITKAKLYRRFMSPILSIRSIASYLSSIITEDNLAEVEKVGTMDKVKIAHILIELNFTIAELENKSNIIDVNEIDKQIKDLSVDSIKTLLTTIEKSSGSADMTKSAIDLINEDGHLSPEEIAYLQSLSSAELLKIVEQILAAKKT